MTAVEQAFEALGRVVGDDGRPLVDVQGVDQRAWGAWRDILSSVQDEIVVWSRTYR